MLKLGKMKKEFFLKSLIGEKLNVIVEKKSGEFYIGKAENFSDVVIDSLGRTLEKGKVYKVEVESVYKIVSLKAKIL